MNPTKFAMTSSHRILFFSLIAVLSSCTSALIGQVKDERTELGIRQRLVERQMEELETKLTTIADRLKEKEPERAARLISAYQQSRELLITKKMTEVSELLDKEKFTDANKKLDEVISGLETLIKILVDQKEEKLSKEQEMQMLEKWKDNINERIREQQQQRKESEKVADKEKTIKNLEVQIKKLKDLIEKQNEAIEETGKNIGAPLRTLDKVADKQFEIRRETEDLMKELEGENPQNPSSDKPSDEQNSKEASDGNKAKEGPSKKGQEDKKSDDPKPDVDKKSDRLNPNHPDMKKDDSKSGDSKSGDSKSGDSKSGDSKSGDSKSGESKSGESKSDESKSDDSKSGDKQNQPPQPGQQALQKATEKQERAEDKLSSGKPADAKRQQEEAVKDMNDALAELEKEKRRIESLPPEALQQMAEQQRRTRDKAMELVEEMKKAPKPEDQDSKGGDSDQQSQPGEKSTEQAGKSMDKASEDLQKQDPDKAKENQKKAEEELQQAKQEIEDRLNQLREETREEKLARLEARFQEMLDRQIVASVMTIEIDDKKSNLGELRRRDHLTLLQLATEELEISEIGQQAYDLLLEDGSSSVFPEIVQEVREELSKVAQLLKEEQTNQLTQLFQKELEYSIQDLLDAMKEARKEAESGGGGGGGGGGEQPLLKKSFELKIMKLRQIRLNRRAKGVEQARNQQNNEVIEKELKEAAEKQGELIEMLEGVLQNEDQEAKGGGG